MDKQEFIEKFSEALFAEESSLSISTVFRTLDEWSSVSYLSVIAMLDEEYDIQIENCDFKNLIIIGDIISYIESHQ